MDISLLLEIFTAVSAAIIAWIVVRNKKDHELRDEIKTLWAENRQLRQEVEHLREVIVTLTNQLEGMKGKDG